MKPFIDSSFWSDPDIETAKPGVKLAALWLITNPRTSLIGLCESSLARFELETGLKAEVLARALEALPRAFKKFGNTVFVTRYIQHQFGRGDKLKRNNFFVALRSLFGNVKDEELREYFLAEYPEFDTEPERASQGLVKPKEGREGEDRKGRGSAEGVKKPALGEVVEYGKEIGMSPEQVGAWYDHFESNGWRVSGKTPMRDWRAGLRNGRRYIKTLPNGSGSPPPKTGLENIRIVPSA